MDLTVYKVSSLLVPVTCHDFGWACGGPRCPLYSWDSGLSLGLCFLGRYKINYEVSKYER